MDVVIKVTHVYLQRGVASGWATTARPGGVVHHVGHSPWTGWFCGCGRGRRCPMINRLKELLPVEAVELGGRNVRAGLVPAGACAPAPQREEGTR